LLKRINLVSDGTLGPRQQPSIDWAGTERDSDRFETVMEQSRRKKVAALGGGVMKEPNNQGSNPLARKLEGLPPAGLQQIGKELRIKLTEIIGEPLPAELQALLEKLEQEELDQK
jgi:hypothetical protein